MGFFVGNLGNLSAVAVARAGNAGNAELEVDAEADAEADAEKPVGLPHGLVFFGLVGMTYEGSLTGLSGIANEAILFFFSASASFVTSLRMILSPHNLCQSSPMIMIIIIIIIITINQQHTQVASHTPLQSQQMLLELN